jgi:2-methylisocitrate lyase-like PEP mutase family enzyme
MIHWPLAPPVSNSCCCSRARPCCQGGECTGRPCGFDLFDYVTGAGIANTYLGIPDNGLVTLTELCDHVAAIRDVFPGPIMVDADTGFGNVLNMTRTVKLLERAGADAIQIEDQVFPKRCGHFDGKETIPQSEMVAKVRAASTRVRPRPHRRARTDVQLTASRRRWIAPRPIVPAPT